MGNSRASREEVSETDHLNTDRDQDYNILYTIFLE